MTPRTIGLKRSGRVAWLDEPAAEQYAAMLAAGCPSGCVTDAGRTNAEQWEMWRQFLRGELAATAAYPGTSHHESGRALDLAEPARSWVRSHGAAFGWQKDRVPREPWHFEFDPSTIPAPPPRKDDDTMILLFSSRSGWGLLHGSKFTGLTSHDTVNALKQQGVPAASIPDADWKRFAK